MNVVNKTSFDSFIKVWSSVSEMLIMTNLQEEGGSV